MAHVAKFSKSALGHMFKHYERNSCIGEYGNESIDREKSHLNYNLAPERENQYKFTMERCQEVKCLNRADVKVMCDWVVTAPKDLNPNQQDDFFKESYNFLENKYGQKNVISAYVHLDEVTPHMHFSFIPVAIDKKKGIEKVSSKEVLTKIELKSFHTDLQNHLESKGIKCSILNEATHEGNKSIAELKRNTAIETLNKLNNDINTLKIQLNALQGQLVAQGDIVKIEPKKTITGAIKGVSVEEIENLKKTAIEYYNLKLKFNDVSKRLKKLESEMVTGVNEKIELSKLRSENIKFKNFIENKGLVVEFNKSKDFIKGKKIDLER